MATKAQYAIDEMVDTLMNNCATEEFAHMGEMILARLRNKMEYDIENRVDNIVRDLRHLDRKYKSI